MQGGGELVIELCKGHGSVLVQNFFMVHR
jgi:hypothetical protein